MVDPRTFLRRNQNRLERTTQPPVARPVVATHFARFVPGPEHGGANEGRSPASIPGHHRHALYGRPPCATRRVRCRQAVFYCVGVYRRRTYLGLSMGSIRSKIKFKFKIVLTSVAVPHDDPRDVVPVVSCELGTTRPSMQLTSYPAKSCNALPQRRAWHLGRACAIRPRRFISHRNAARPFQPRAPECGGQLRSPSNHAPAFNQSEPAAYEDQLMNSTPSRLRAHCGVFWAQRSSTCMQ